jgi:6-phosphogluconolactonase (cycloisomerase 2 family)
MNRLHVLVLMILLTGCAKAAVAPSVGSKTVQNSKIFAYANAQYTNKIWQFSVNKVSGEATALPTDSIDTQALPYALTATSNGKFLIAANYSSVSLSSFSIDPTSGELTLVENHPLAAGAAPSWLISHPSLNLVYVAEAGTSKITPLDIDPNTGIMTARPSVNAGSGVTALEMSRDGRFLYSADQNVDQVGIYTVDPQGDLVKAGFASVPAGSQPNHIKLTPNGNFLYTANWNSASVSSFSVSGTTLTNLGAATAAGAGGVYTVSVTPDGGHLIAAKPYGNNYSVHTIDPITGALGAATVVAHSGAVGISYYKNFAFVTPWSSAVAGLPIETHLTDATAGIVEAASSSTVGLRGLYQFQIVEVNP